MKPYAKTSISLIMFVLLTTVPLACGSGAGSTANQPSTPLEDLQDLTQLQTMFNQDEGKTRLILLLSPT
jgi:hypothetical protein